MHRGQDVRGAVAEHDARPRRPRHADRQHGRHRVRDRPAARGVPPVGSRTTILLLLDREADRFLAKRADADAELVKPVDAGTLRRASRGPARGNGSGCRLTPGYTHRPYGMWRSLVSAQRSGR